MTSKTERSSWIMLALCGLCVLTGFLMVVLAVILAARGQTAGMCLR